jgi:hypothetical protein
LYELGYRQVDTQSINHYVYVNADSKSVVVCILGLDTHDEQLLNKIFDIENIFHLEKIFEHISVFTHNLVSRIDAGQNFITDVTTTYKDYKLYFFGNCLGKYILDTFLPKKYNSSTCVSSFNCHASKKIIDLNNLIVYLTERNFKNLNIFELLSTQCNTLFINNHEDNNVEILCTDPNTTKYTLSGTVQVPINEISIDVSGPSNSSLKHLSYAQGTPSAFIIKSQNEMSTIFLSLLPVSPSTQLSTTRQSSSSSSSSSSYSSYLAATTEQYPLLNGPIKGFFYWQSNYLSASYNSSDGTMTNAPEWCVNSVTSAQDLATAKQYIEGNVNPSAPISATMTEPYSTDPSISAPTGTAKILNYPVKQYEYTSTNLDNSLIPIPEGTNSIALFTGYSHAGLNLQNFYAYEPYYSYDGGLNQNNILNQSLTYLKANFEGSTNYLLGFCVGGGWNYTGGWNTVVTNSYPTTGVNSQNIYDSATVSSTYPITKTYNENQTAESISSVLQYENSTKYMTYVKPFSMTAGAQTSFYLNDSTDPDNGGSLNTAYEWFAPNDLGVGGVYSCYQYITPKGVSFSYTEESTGLLQSGVGLGGVIYSEDPKLQTPKYTNVNDTGYYKFEYDTNPLQVNCIFFDVETWGKVCWPYPNGSYAFPDPTDPTSNYIWTEDQKLNVPNGVDMYDANDPNAVAPLDACYSTAKDFLTLFSWIKTQYPFMKIILTTPHSCGNFTDARNKVTIGAKEFVPLFEGGTFYNYKISAFQNCYDLISPQNYTCNLGTSNEYAANENLPWTITDPDDTSTVSFQSAISKNEQYKLFGLNFIVPAVNFGTSSQSYNCYEDGGSNSNNSPNLYYYQANYNDQTNNTNNTSSFPTYYGSASGSNTIPYDEDTGTKDFYKAIMGYNGETIPNSVNTGGGCMQWVNGDLN